MTLAQLTTREEARRDTARLLTTDGRNAGATQHNWHASHLSDGSPSSRDNFFFPTPLQIQEGLTIPTMPIFPRNQPMSALLVHRVGAGRGQSVKQGDWIFELFLTSAHLTTREGSRRDTARLLTEYRGLTFPFCLASTSNCASSEKPFQTLTIW